MEETGQNKTDIAAESDKPNYGKGSSFHGKKGRSGAKKGNQHALRHGMRGSKLPAGCLHIEHAVNELRRLMETEVLKVKGEIGVMDAAAINSILNWQKHGLLAAYWLRKEISTMSLGDRLRFSAEIAKASDARDRNIRLLGLDIKPEPIDLRGYIESKGNGDDEEGEQ